MRLKIWVDLILWRGSLSVTKTSVDARNTEEEDATKDTDVTASQKKGVKRKF